MSDVRDSAAVLDNEMNMQTHIADVISVLPQRQFKNMQYVADMAGEAAAVLHLAPPLYADNVVEALRRGRKLGQAERSAALAQAAEIFLHGCLCGLTPESYCRLTERITGLPTGIVRDSMAMIAETMNLAGELEKFGQMQPSSSQPNAEQARQGCAQWRRKGDVLAVLAPGNAPGVHALWLQAVALGYKVAVRPSARDPLTPQRVTAALAQAGLQDYAALFPTDYSGGDALIKAADLALIYGGDDVARRFSGRADILVQGSGRSKILIGKDYPRDKALPLIWESVVGLGGTACICASAVLAEGDCDFAQKLAHDFYRFAKEKFADEAERRQWALRLSAEKFTWLTEFAAQMRPHLVGAVETAKNTDGTYYAMPMIRITENIGDPMVQSELPVAAVTFAPFNRATDLPFIGDTLVLTVASADESLIAELEELHGVHNFYIGSVPTVWLRQDVPHDGFLAEFLMKTRGYKRL